MTTEQLIAKAREAVAHYESPDGPLNYRQLYWSERLLKRALEWGIAGAGSAYRCDAARSLLAAMLEGE